ncbi:MAG: hypothetical protein HOI65_18035 [Opitutae bacterium]|nr:hypothetical protein [Opitutae bacterium]
MVEEPGGHNVTVFLLAGVGLVASQEGHGLDDAHKCLLGWCAIVDRGFLVHEDDRPGVAEVNDKVHIYRSLGKSLPPANLDLGPCRQVSLPSRAQIEFLAFIGLGEFRDVFRDVRGGDAAGIFSGFVRLETGDVNGTTLIGADIALEADPYPGVAALPAPPVEAPLGGVAMLVE